MATTHSEHNDILELLPWYANGTLSETETRRVRDYLEQHPELAADAEHTEALMNTLGDEVPVPMLTHARLSKVMNRLDDHEQARNPLRDLLQRISNWWSDSPAFALPLAATTAVALLAFVFMQMPASNEGDYRTLSSERPPVSIQVEFESRVDTADAAALFESLALDAQHETGSVYVVTLPGDMPVTELFETLQVLRDDDRVVDAKALTDED